MCVYSCKALICTGIVKVLDVFQNPSYVQVGVKQLVTFSKFSLLHLWWRHKLFLHLRWLWRNMETWTCLSSLTAILSWTSHCLASFSGFFDSVPFNDQSNAMIKAMPGNFRLCFNISGKWCLLWTSSTREASYTGISRTRTSSLITGLENF